jgi:peptidoglycan-N-acetylmuramic acid deacetylase
MLAAILFGCSNQSNKEIVSSSSSIVKNISSESVASTISSITSSKSVVSSKSSSKPSYSSFTITPYERKDTSQINEDITKGYDTTPKSFPGMGKAPYLAKDLDRCAYLQEYNSLYTFLTDQKQIFLTFDLGYENGYTNSILDTLKQKNVKAIFFITQQPLISNPEIIKRIADEGHLLGNHTKLHKNFSEISVDTMKSEVLDLEQIVFEKIGVKMKYFRFPSGNYNEKSLFIIKQLGLVSVFWDFSYLDWDRENQPDEKEALSKVVASFHSGEIMLLHAISKTNAAILPTVIDKARQQGYEFSLLP